MSTEREDPRGRLDRKVVLVTGGHGGIGAETVRLFDREGATVVAADIRDHGAPPSRVHPRRLRVNAICPGSIATPITDSADFADTDWSAYTATIPLGRRGDPADVAELALYLTSDAGSYVTGTEITVDGGITAGRRFPKTG